jgi:hypothetical protein
MTDPLLRVVAEPAGLGEPLDFEAFFRSNYELWAFRMDQRTVPMTPTTVGNRTRLAALGSADTARAST